MKIKIILTVILALQINLLMAQFGEIRGVVIDINSGEPLSGATVAYSVGGNLMGTTTNNNGEYKIKPLVSGEYDLSFSYVTYQAQKINAVKVSAEKITFVDVKLLSDLTLPPIEIVWEEPLIDAGAIQNMKVIGAEEIEQSISRDPVSMAATTAGVYQRDDGGSLNIRGSRSNSTIYVVDGIKMFGDFSVPKNAIEEITVLTGGIPAQYGDATGGVILITTKSYNRKRK